MKLCRARRERRFRASAFVPSFRAAELTVYLAPRRMSDE
jgi:hypothetical protein